MRIVRINSNLPDAASGWRFPERDLSERVIGAFYDTYNEVGYGFLEKVYSSALAIVLRERGYSVERERAYDVVFHGQTIGRYRADLVIDGRLVLEVKSGSAIPAGSKEQLQNYLRISRIEVGLILHFGPKPEFKRMIFSSAGPDQI